MHDEMPEPKHPQAGPSTHDTTNHSHHQRKVRTSGSQRLSWGAYVLSCQEPAENLALIFLLLAACSSQLRSLFYHTQWAGSVVRWPCRPTAKVVPTPYTRSSQKARDSQLGIR